ncbi:hypothetical protein D3C79_574520 [compost metagenome]
MQVQALHRQLVLVVGQDLLGRDDPGADDALVVVQVSQKQVQRLDPLNAAPLHHPPFTGGNTARNRIEGNQPLGALLVAIEGEGDAGAVEQQVGFTSTLGQQLRRGFGQPAGERPVMRTDQTVSGVHFVIKGADHAELLVTRAPEPSQAPCQRHNSLLFNKLRFKRRTAAPDLCNRPGCFDGSASLRSAERPTADGQSRPVGPFDQAS